MDESIGGIFIGVKLLLCQNHLKQMTLKSEQYR